MKLSEKAQESLNKVIAAFESGDLSPVVSIIKIRRDPNDTMPAHAWSLGNQLIAYIQSGGVLDCRGFRQWEQVGRNVCKGARAVYILSPNTIKVEDKKTGEEKRVVSGFHAIPVFPLTATEGKDLPAFDYAPAAMPPLFDVATKLGVTVDYGVTQGGVGGWFDPTHQHIHLGTQNAAVFFHELAHAAHDKVESLLKVSNEEERSEEETIAEFTAAVLSELYGFPHTGNAWRYLQAYSPDPLTAIYKAMSTIEKVLALILDETTTND